MYLAGYAIECKLKAKLMYQSRVLTLQKLEGQLGVDFKIHNLSELGVRLLGWKHALKDEKFKRDWGVVRLWSVSWRYDRELSDSISAKKFLASVDQVLKWLENNV